jgi:hypothetical protein
VKKNARKRRRGKKIFCNGTGSKSQTDQKKFNDFSRILVKIFFSLHFSFLFRCMSLQMTKIIENERIEKNDDLLAFKKR